MPDEQHTVSSDDCELGASHVVPVPEARRADDPATGQPVAALPPIETTGVILKTLVDTYGVLPPELVETVLPEQPNP